MTNIKVANCRNCGNIICTDEAGGWVHALPLPSEVDGEMVDLSTACRPDFDGSTIADPPAEAKVPRPGVMLNGTGI